MRQSVPDDYFKDRKPQTPASLLKFQNVLLKRSTNLFSLGNSPSVAVILLHAANRKSLL